MSDIQIDASFHAKEKTLNPPSMEAVRPTEKCALAHFPVQRNRSHERCFTGIFSGLESGVPMKLSVS
ncbi:MAG: hypothetical protein JRJ60_16435 [Deltaproteobacteria bacterium]|nr:hypothetical protein [Deltaproteobacteria bacterium]